ncbi:pirin family protein [Pontibacter sp. BT310]|uniref:Pirin family protein n=1 Tax=Pontibacter populi TaxID=890055 RepID=A0ABS6XAQ4_9BACT|nr:MULTISPECIES: pirin family protein [Pontibacter]MBJ6118203.1 pirin family protein [Pontibacter sp. BT310]MBR0570630.1 pirin family protein [Microvirga sp. STS03]MBW3365056.1 pirin family protein [Pontibacter populi]
MLDIVIEARKAAIAPGMDVRRILPFRLRRMVGPFIFMDHAGPVDVAPELTHSMDVLPHPHIGLSTVSYLFGGQVTHRDSLGVEQIIRPGEVNWMTAGSGISHSERFEDPSALAGGNLEMIQTWVALPEKDEEDAPAFTNYKPEQLPIYTDTGVWMRLIAGDAYGLRNDVKTHSPLFYLHVVLQKDARISLPKEHSERGIYVAKGIIEVAGRAYTVGQMLVFNKTAEPVIVAKEPTTLMLLGGEPLGERYIWWNFVSSRKERIEQAKADWKAGRIILPPNDNAEFVPLPEDKSRPAGNPAPQALS